MKTGLLLPESLLENALGLTAGFFTSLRAFFGHHRGMIGGSFRTVGGGPGVLGGIAGLGRIFLALFLNGTGGLEQLSGFSLEFFHLLGAGAPGRKSKHHGNYEQHANNPLHSLSSSSVNRFSQNKRSFRPLCNPHGLLAPGE
jgi:hypothetical protein